MDITKELTEELVATVKISLSPADYIDPYEKELKKFAKTASMKGFRPGTVPKSMVQKMYGKSILFDELNKIVGQSLQNYLKESQIQLLGDPLPQPITEFDMDFENPKQYDFAFDIGLAPQFELITPAVAVPYYEITVDDSKIEESVKDILSRNGNFTQPEISDIDCILYGTFVELDADGNPKENGLSNKTTLMIEMVKDADTQKKMIGVSKDAVIVFNLQKALQNNAEIGAMFNVPAEVAEGITTDFSLTVETIGKRTKAEMNQELFDKLYEPGTVTDEAAFRNKVREELAHYYKIESDRKLKHDLEDVMLDELKLQLPDAFLKRWLKVVSEKPLTDEEIERDYPHYRRGIMLRLIENKVMKAQNMEITDDEIRAMAKDRLYSEFSRYGMMQSLEGSMDSFVDRYLQKEENWNKTIESLQNFKAFAYLQGIVNRDVKNVTFDEFVKIVSEHQHVHAH